MSDESKNKPQKTIIGMPKGPSPAESGTLVGVGDGRDPAALAHDKTIAPTPSGGGLAATIVTRGPKKGCDAPPLLGDDEALVGAELSGYRIERKLAEGGMGVVYVGEHQKIGKRAAIKVLKLEYCRDESVVARFTQEARAVNEIRHENIVEIYDFGRDPGGRVYYVMELLEGESLDARVKGQRLSFAEMAATLEQISRALDAAHAKGFVHRDLKPENIWLRPGPGGRPQVKLLDFGIAKLIGSENVEEKLTRTGTIIGTPHYMSPEQINGSAKIDHRSDIYSLGVILYEIVSGKRPFHGETLQAIIAGHVLSEPPPMGEMGDHPRSIERVIGRMLAKSPDDRYQNVTDVASDLRDIAHDRPPSLLTTLERQRPVAAPTKTPGSAKKWAVIAVVAAVLIAGAAVAVAVKVTQKDDAPTNTPTTTARTTTTATQPVTNPELPPLDLEALRSEARSLIRSSLEDGEPAVRVDALGAAADTSDLESVPRISVIAEKDPDAEVRGHAASALGALGASSALPLLSNLLKAADDKLAPWFAEALAKLGELRGRRALEKLAGEKELATSFKAALALADLSEPGDKKAISALRKLAAREAELVAIAPYAGVALLTRLARLGVGEAREALRDALGSEDGGARLAAAEALAKLGDDTSIEILRRALADGQPPTQVVAAASLIDLGDYSGYDVLSESLTADAPGIRKISARGLGAIGEKRSLLPLVALYGGAEKSVRIAAAAAVLRIVGLEPALLAQTSIDWAKSALASDDWAIREAAATTLGDLPEGRAVPLLAQAIADPDKKVRSAAATSAAKMRGKKAAEVVAAVALTETDQGVKELQVRALGAIGQPESKDALFEIAKARNRVGIIALGSLIAVGDTGSAARLEAAVVDDSSALRLAAVEAALVANNPIAVPTLEKGVVDKKFEVRFSASEGLAFYKSAKDRALEVLREALGSRDESVRGRAQAAMLRFGETPDGFEPKALLDAEEASARLAALKAIAVLPWLKAESLLRRAARDSDNQVRRAAVDAVRSFESSERESTVRFYKLLVDDRDEITKQKSRGRLADLTAAAPPPGPAAPTAPTPTSDPDLAPSLEAAKSARATYDAAAAEIRSLAAKVKAKTSQPAKDEAELDAVERIGKDLDAAANSLKAAASSLDAAVAKTREIAARSSDAESVAAGVEANKLADTAASGKQSEAGLDEAREAIKSYVRAETADPGVYVAAADAAIATGKLSSAKRDLRKAEAIYKKQGKVDPQLYFSYGRLYDKLAAGADSDASRLENLRKAKSNYDRFASRGSGKRLSQAQARSAEIDAEIKALEK